MSASTATRVGTAPAPACARAAPGRWRPRSARCSSRTDASRSRRLGACGTARSAVQALAQVDDHALAQRAAGRQQRLDAEVRGQRVQDRQPAGQHRAAVVAQRRPVQLVDVAGLRGSRSMHQRRPCGVMRAVGSRRWPPAAATPRRPCPTSPAPPASAAARRAAAPPRARRRRRPARRGRRLSLSLPSPKKRIDRLTLPTWKDSATQRRAALAEDHLGGAPADVDHQPRACRRAAGATRRRRSAVLPRGPEMTSIGWPSAACARAAGRRRGCAPRAASAWPPRAPAADAKPRSRSAKRRQAVQPALHGGFGEHAVGVEPAAQAHGFLQVVDAPVAAVLQLADLEPEAVRAHVDGGQRAGQNAGWAAHRAIVPMASRQGPER